MTCEEARAAFLEADPEELDERGTTLLSKHLAACPACRGLARTVLDAEAELASSLVRLVQEPDLEAVIERGLGTPPSPRTTLPRSILRSPLKALVPLALAAGLAGLLVLRDPPLPGPVSLPRQASAGFEVEAPPDQNIMVLSTKDPNITVLWLF